MKPPSPPSSISTSLKREWLSRLRCPGCGAPLAMDGSTGETDTVTKGSLLCAGCGQRYDVRSGIPRFVPLENYASNFGFQWNRFRRTQLDSYSGVPITKQRFFEQVPLAPEELADLQVLDVGCGAGRFAEVALSAGAHVTCVDYSSAIDAAAENLAHLDRFLPLQGDIYSLPLAPASFDLVYCLGVLQHTPDVSGAFRALARYVKPGGLLVVDFYHRTWRDCLHPKRWLRPLTVRMEQRRLFAVVERLAPSLLSVSRAVGRVPLIGRALTAFRPDCQLRRGLPVDAAAG